jgi:hypothetical protein
MEGIFDEIAMADTQTLIAHEKKSATGLPLFSEKTRGFPPPPIFGFFFPRTLAASGSFAAMGRPHWPLAPQWAPFLRT